MGIFGSLFGSGKGKEPEINTAVVFYSSDLLTQLDGAGALAGFRVAPPKELIPKADAALNLQGELLRLANEGEIKIETVADMTDQQWETFLKSRYRGRIDRWTAKTPKSTYNVVVVRAV